MYLWRFKCHLRNPETEFYTSENCIVLTIDYFKHLSLSFLYAFAFVLENKLTSK